MKHKKGYGAVLAIALMVVALAAVVVFSGATFAQPTGIGVEREVVARRAMFYPNSSMYPGIIIDHSSTSDLMDMGVSGVSAFRIENSGQTTIKDAVLIDGDTDEVQLTVQAHTTATNSVFVVETSAGVDQFWVEGAGDVEINGTTPKLTIGDAGEEDTSIVFDGEAQDFHIGLDDTADDLVVGLGSALGTTPAFAIDEDVVTTWTGGTIELAETLATTDTLTAAECGKNVFLNATNEFATTLPAMSTVAAGCRFRFVVDAAPSGVSYTVITGNSLENLIFGLALVNGAGVTGASEDTITFTQAAAIKGDWAEVVSDGSSWFVSGQGYAATAITLTAAD